MIDKELENELQNLRDYKVIANCIETLSVICATNPDKVIDKLTGYGWDEEESVKIKAMLKGDYDEVRSDLFMTSARKAISE